MDNLAKKEAQADLHGEFQDKLKAYSARLVQNPDWNSVHTQADLKRIVALCWPFIDRYSRSKFIAFLDDDMLYCPPAGMPVECIKEVEMINILKNWPDVLTDLSGKELEFANDVDKRRRWKNWKPTEKQAEWIMAIYAAHIEPDLEVAE